MNVLDFDYDEMVAVTETDGLIEVWSDKRWSIKDKSKVFSSAKGKAVLYSDGGRRWKEDKETAPYCEFAQFWYGNFPYGSWCYAIKKTCDSTVTLSTISTDINPRGESSSDRWKRRCQTYAPPNAAEVTN